jgi:hypothetical protein
MSTLRSIALSTATAVSCLLTGTVGAEAQDKSQYTLFNPTPKDKMREFSTDRPTKSNVPYTVDAGHFQYEADAFIYSFDNTTIPGTDITSFVLANPTFKLGLTNYMDFEVNFSAYNNIRAQTRVDGSSTVVQRVRRRHHASQDQPVRQRRRWTGDGADPLRQVADRAARGRQSIRRRRHRRAAGSTPAARLHDDPDGPARLLKNPNDAGYHVNFPALININRQIVEGVTAYAEIYANWSTHSEVRDIYTLDFAVAWSPFPNFPARRRHQYRPERRRNAGTRST